MEHTRRFLASYRRPGRVIVRVLEGPDRGKHVEVDLDAHQRVRGGRDVLNDIVLNDEIHEVRVRGDIVHLTPIEYQLLRYLMSMPDKPVSKQDLFRNVWGYDMAGGTNLVEVAVRRLREKIEKDASSPEYLLTVRGAGYKFNTRRD